MAKETAYIIGATGGGETWIRRTPLPDSQKIMYLGPETALTTWLIVYKNGYPYEAFPIVGEFAFDVPERVTP